MVNLLYTSAAFTYLLLLQRSGLSIGKGLSSFVETVDKQNHIFLCNAESKRRIQININIFVYNKYI